MSFKAFGVWFICVLFFLYEFFLRTVVGAYQQPLMSDLQLDMSGFSLLSSTIFLLMYGIMQLPVGFVIDRIGLKKGLLIGAGLCTISTFGFSVSDTFFPAILWRLTMGIGAAFGFIGVLVSVTDWIVPQRRAFMIGLSQLIGTLGPVFSAAPLEKLSKTYGTGWRTVFFYAGCVGASLFVIIFIFVKNQVSTKSGYILLRRTKSIKENISYFLGRTQPWLIGLYASTTYFCLEYLSENEGRAILMGKGLSSIEAASAITISWLSYALSCLLLGSCSDFFKRRKVFLVLPAVSSLCALILFLMSKNTLLLWGAFALIGFAAAGQGTSYIVTAENFKRAYTAAGFGLNNAMIMIFSAVNAPLIGFMTTNMSSSTLGPQAIIFSVMFFVALSAIIFSLRIRETYGKSNVEWTVIRPS